MEVRLLGPVELTVAGEPVELGPPRQRAALAALLVDAPAAVPVDVLVERVWGEDPPPAGRTSLYSHIARIRRMLAEHGLPGVERGPGGYSLAFAPSTIDLFQYQKLIERGDAKNGAGVDARACALRAALRLWRGEPLGGVPGDWADHTRDRLAQQRLTTLVAWADLELRLGRVDAVVDELRPALVQHPLAEPLIAALMQGLYASGRSAEALARYAEARHRFGADLGAEPGPDLRRLHQAILRDDRHEILPATAVAAVQRPAPRPVPAQLPPDLPGFTPRDADLRRLDALVADHAADGGSTAVVIAAVAGPAGVGKTALAVSWGRRVADRFPGGQLYVDLGGAEPGRSMCPSEAIRRFLDALGVPPERIPANLETRAGLYRSLLAGRRALIVLDNARDSEQVRPLLPGSAGCLALITSRVPLTGLIAAEGARPLILDDSPQRSHANC